MSIEIKTEKIDATEGDDKTMDLDSQKSASNEVKPEIKQEDSSNKPQIQKKIHFQCGDCGLTEEADFYGRKPPFCRAVMFNEDSYICRDPFSPQGSNTANFLLLGSNCAVCETMTCQECSVFYNTRFCAKCAKTAQQSLPQQLKITKVNKD